MNVFFLENPSMLCRTKFRVRFEKTERALNVNKHNIFFSNFKKSFHFFNFSFFISYKYFKDLENKFKNEIFPSHFFLQQASLLPHQPIVDQTRQERSSTYLSTLRIGLESKLGNYSNQNTLRC